MADKFIDDRNLKLLLYEMFDVESLLKYPRYADHSREVFDMVMDTAMKMGKDLFRPIFSEMDKNPPEYVKGQVKVHPAVKNIMREADCFTMKFISRLFCCSLLFLLCLARFWHEPQRGFQIQRENLDDLAGLIMMI